MCFTIVCCVFSRLCSFPVVHAVITQGCQLHRLSVLVLQKPLSSYPSGLDMTNAGGDSVVTMTLSDFQKPGWRFPSSVQLSFTLFIYLLCTTIPGWTLWSLLYRSLSFRHVKRTLPVSLEKSVDVKKKYTEYCNSFHTSISGFLLRSFLFCIIVCSHTTVKIFQTKLKAKVVIGQFLPTHIHSH